MIGLANALGLDLGEVVATNLVYQLERIGVNCSNWNNTGPTLDDDAIKSPRLTCADAQAQFDLSQSKKLETGPAGYCTSIFSENDQDTMLHGRNLDWNIPDILKDFVLDLDVYQNGELLYHGTGVVGFVGMLNGMRVQGERWSVSMDARHHGGHIFANFVEALTEHALTPEQNMRKTLEDVTIQGFDQAVASMSNSSIVDDVYYILAGEASGQGVVITHERNGPRDVWYMGTSPDTPPHPDAPKNTDDDQDDEKSSWWWLTETNYDHWEPVPKADDRRDPANSLMLALTSAANVNNASLFDVLSTWPVFNPHTTFTSMMNPSTGSYNSTVWYGNFGN
jgi:hypothetical protein